MKSFVITANNNQQIFRDVAFKDGVDTYEFDFSPWVDDNHTVTTVTWTVKAGSATITGQALTSNVASAQITFPNEGGSLIQIKATTGTETFIAYLDVLAKDPNSAVSDYGMVS